MAESIAPTLAPWRNGMHPRATELRIRALGRVRLQLGEALRIETATLDADGDDLVHLQYYIATELGPWAVWLTAPRADVADAGASLQALTPPFAEG
jgi:hypothetical protein